MAGIGVNSDGSPGDPVQVLSGLDIENNGVPLHYKRQMRFAQIGFTGSPLQFTGAAGYFHTDSFETIVGGQPITVSQAYRSIECRVGWENLAIAEPRWISIDAVIRKQ